MTAALAIARLFEITLELPKSAFVLVHIGQTFLAQKGSAVHAGSSCPFVSGASSNSRTPRRNKKLSNVAASFRLMSFTFRIQPLRTRIGAARMRPTLKQKPPPVLRSRVGNNSGKYTA